MKHLLITTIAAALFGVGNTTRAQDDAPEPLKRHLYVAEPGIRNYTQYGGHGVIAVSYTHLTLPTKRIV